MAAAEDYPEGLKYHAEHDWARIEGDEATLGVTWFAQDALGELVHFEAPADGGSTTKDASYGEVESVKAVSDVIAPLSGEILEVNQKVVDAPETVNEDPYGEGWLVRIRLADPAEVDASSTSRRTSSTWPSRASGVSSRATTLDCLTARRCWRRSASRRSRSSSATSRPGSASRASSISSRRSRSPSSSATWRSSRRRTSTRRRSSRSSARGSTTTTSPRSSTRSCSAASSSPPTRRTSRR